MFRYVGVAIIFFAITKPSICSAQDSVSLVSKAFSLPDKFFNGVDRKSEKFQQRILRSTTKYLSKLERRELRLKKQLTKKDSAAANQVFGNVQERYDKLKAIASDPSSSVNPNYIGHLDSLKTTLKFLDNQQIIPGSKKITESIGALQKGQESFNMAGRIQQELDERHEFIKNKIQQTGVVKQYNKLRQDVYYYKQQLQEYRNMFEDPSKLQTLVLTAVSEVPAFAQFFAKHSQLGSLFMLPANPGNATALSGMQTRTQLMEQLGSRLGVGTNTSNMIASSINDGQTAVQQLKDKLSGSQGNGDPDMPNFKPNDKKSKSFFNRLDVGANMQNVKSSYFFPSTTDLGVSIGYNFRPNIVAGIGAAYKMGWGKSIRHISISHEGVGLRTFLDVKLKGSFWLTGGSELNYRSAFKKIEELKDESAWQQSILAGLSKKVQVKNRKADFKLLYDFLYRQQRPEGQPLIFRVGYSLK